MVMCSPSRIGVRNLCALCVLLAGVSWLGSTARAEILDFEDLTGNHLAIPNGYGGLDWTNFSLLIDPGPAYSDPNSVLGSFYYRNPVISSSHRFDWSSSRITSPAGPLTLKVIGYRNGAIVYNPGWYYPNQYGHITPPAGTWTDIDKIEFIRMGGTDYFALDDFEFAWHYVPQAGVDDSFAGIAPLGTLGYIVSSATATGLGEIVVDPQDGGNYLLRLFDSDAGAVSVDVTKTTILADDFAKVEFDFRFLTDGKLRVKLGGTVVDTIAAPTAGDGAPGSTGPAHYVNTFSLAAAGLSQGEVSFSFELVHAGDPELYLDNIQVTAVPEPASLSLLALGTLCLIRRR